MKSVNRIGLLMAAISLALVGSVWADGSSSDIVKGTKIIGKPVYNLAAKEIGHIEDLAVDETSGRIVYAVLSYGGFMGLGDKYFAVPWEAMLLSNDRHHFVLDVKKKKLEEAPGFDKSQWPNFADPATHVVIYEFYDIPAPKAGTDKTSSTSTGSRSSRTAHMKGTAGDMTAATAEKIKPTVSEALTHARKAVDAGEHGDAKALVGHAEQALSKAKHAQAAGLNDYLNEGVYELGEAIEHGGKKQTADATEHVRHAIMRLSQAADLQLPN